MKSKGILVIFVVLSIVLIMTACKVETEEMNTQEGDISNQLTNQMSNGAESPQIELTYYGRASVQLKLDNGTIVYIDPYVGSYTEKADIVLVTHQHTDHNQVNKISGKEDVVFYQFPMDLRYGDIIEEKGLKIEVVKAYNSTHIYGSACGYIIIYGDIVIYHSGDTSMTEQMPELAELDIDYALLCMDGYYNMDPEEAMEVAEVIQSEAVIPIHSSKDDSYDLENSEKYTLDNRIIVEPGNSITLYDLSGNEGISIPFEQAIEGIIENRLSALEAKDYDGFMSNITKRNIFFFNEQERWFMEMIDSSIQDISIEIESTEMIDSKTAIVNLHQTHRTTETFDFEYPLLFRYEEGQWKDYGYAFEELVTERFVVKYMDGETRVDEFRVMLDDAFDHLDELYELKPLDDYEMKLFFDQEMLRQRCIPSNPWLFTGWSEPDESLKMYTGHKTDYQGYPGVVQHELVHHLSIRMCNNNLPLWLLEGIAMYDGSAYYGEDSSRLLSSITKASAKKTIMDLEEKDLNNDQITTDEIYAFYGTSYMYVKYIEEIYGRETLMEIFTEAGKKPFHDSTLNETFEVKNQATATEVLLTVLGLTKEELSQDYLEWLQQLGTVPNN